MQSKQALSEQQVETLVVQLNELNNEFKKTEDEYKAKKSSLCSVLKDYMALKKIDSLDFLFKAGRYKDRPTNFSIKHVCPKKIIFDPDKMEKKLSKMDKNDLSEIIHKTYKINDIDGLIEYLKSCGVNPKKFKEFLTIEKVVDNKKVDEFSKIGKITEKDVEGCYTVKENESYFKISEVEYEGDEGK